MDISFIALCVAYMLTHWFHFKQTQSWARERKDLYDRIMSKDLREYKEHVEPPPVYDPVDNTEEAEWVREQTKGRAL